MTGRARRLAPKPPEPPEGRILFYRREVAIEYAERHAQRIMGNFDRLPAAIRFALNYAPEHPQRVGKIIGRYGVERAATVILKSHWDNVFKTRDRRSVQI